MTFIRVLFIDWIFPNPTRRSEFPFRLIVARLSYPGGNCIRERVDERDRKREREGWGEMAGVSEREILCQHSTISEEYFDVDSSVDYHHFTRVVKATTAACRYVRFRWRTCFFFFFISSDFSVIIWGRRNGVEYHYFTESCPVRPPPLTFSTLSFWEPKKLDWTGVHIMNHIIKTANNKYIKIYIAWIRIDLPTLLCENYCCVSNYNQLAYTFYV